MRQKRDAAERAPSWRGARARTRGTAARRARARRSAPARGSAARSLSVQGDVGQLEPSESRDRPDSTSQLTISSFTLDTHRWASRGGTTRPGRSAARTRPRHRRAEAPDAPAPQRQRDRIADVRPVVLAGVTPTCDEVYFSPWSVTCRRSGPASRWRPVPQVRRDADQDPSIAPRRNPTRDSRSGVSRSRARASRRSPTSRFRSSIRGRARTRRAFELALHDDELPPGAPSP